MERVSLSGNKQLKCSSGIVKPPFNPQKHQIRVVKEFLQTNERGLGFFHALGSGKTCAAYLAVDAFRKINKENKTVYILSPASLASSHQYQYCNVCGESPHDFNKNFKFYSYNDRQGIIKKLPKLDNSIIIIDEVQELLNGKENKSASLSYVYNAILNAKNVKIILLSGTPCYTPFQCSLYLNLLKPGITSLDEDAFLADIQRKDYLLKKCKGLISYVPIPDKKLYPERLLPDIIETFPMSEFQYNQYHHAFEDEQRKFRVSEKKMRDAIRRGNKEEIKQLKAIDFVYRTRLKTRQICNFAYPEELKDSKEAFIEGNDKNASWILNDESDIHVKNLKMYSPKMAKLIYRCLTLPGKHMVYGWFKSRYGLYLIDAYLRHCGIEPLLFSGDLGSDEKRAKVIETFNHKNNSRGEKHKVILVSGAGAMGISLYGIRHFHNFEASLNEFISVQAEGRAFRTMSHHQLPPEERNVRVYRYFTGMPRDENGMLLYGDKSNEEIMYERGKENMKKTEEVLDIMKRASFDCRESYNSAIKNCYNFEQHINEEANDDYDFGDVENVYEEEIFED